MRSFLAVVTGYLVFAVGSVLLFRLSGVKPGDPPTIQFAVISILCGMALAFLGGFAAAALGHARPRFHSGLVALIIAVIAVASLIAQFDSGSVWSQAAAVVLMAPAAALGGLLRERRP